MDPPYIKIFSQRWHFLLYALHITTKSAAELLQYITFVSEISVGIKINKFIPNVHYKGQSHFNVSTHFWIIRKCVASIFNTLRILFHFFNMNFTHVFVCLLFIGFSVLIFLNFIQHFVLLYSPTYFSVLVVGFPKTVTFQCSYLFVQSIPPLSSVLLHCSITCVEISFN